MKICQILASCSILVSHFIDLSALIKRILSPRNREQGIQVVDWLLMKFAIKHRIIIVTHRS